MKFLSTLLLTVALFASSLFADVVVLNKSFDEAKKTAQKENKMVMLILSQDGCNMCDYLKYVLLKNQDIAAEVNGRFVPVDIDIHTGKIPSGFRAYGTPTIYFTDGAGNKIGRQIVGVAKPDAFLETLRNVKKAQ